MRLVQRALFAQKQPSSEMPDWLRCLLPHNEARRGASTHAVLAKLRLVAGSA